MAGTGAGEGWPQKGRPPAPPDAAALPTQVGPASKALRAPPTPTPHTPRSMLAAAAVYAARLALGRAPAFPPMLACHCGYSPAQLGDCAAALAALHRCVLRS